MLKKLMICTGILLAGCGQKPSADINQQQAQLNATAGQVQQQAANGALVAGQPMAQVPALVVAQNAPRQAIAPARAAYAEPQYQQNQQYQQYQPQPQQQVTTIYVDPPLEQPPPVRVSWAPPPLLVEEVPPPPSGDAVWTGGYWVWRDNWVWAHGRWAEPPRRDYRWEHPYYEHRGDSVVFVDGYWRAPDRSFVPPPRHAEIPLAVLAAGLVAGERPHGPEGVFVPPPPGSHRGMIVPAPLGTPPGVAMHAPPMIREGMHVTVNNGSNNHGGNVTNVSNVTNVTNVTNQINQTSLTLVAPANTTANGQAVHTAIPAHPHAAAGTPPMANGLSPQPAMDHSGQMPQQEHGRPMPPMPPPPMAQQQQQQQQHGQPMAQHQHGQPMPDYGRPMPPATAQTQPAQPQPAQHAHDHAQQQPQAAQQQQAAHQRQPDNAGNPNQHGQAPAQPMPAPPVAQQQQQQQHQQQQQQHHDHPPQAPVAMRGPDQHAPHDRRPEAPPAAQPHAAPPPAPEQHPARPPMQLASAARPAPSTPPAPRPAPHDDHPQGHEHDRQHDHDHDHPQKKPDEGKHQDERH